MELELLLGSLIKCIVISVILFLLFRIFSSSKLPPGPIGLPIIGSLFLLRNTTPSVLYNKLHKQYGDIFSIRLGSKLFVIVNGSTALNEVFVKRGDVFSDRPNTYLFSVVFMEKGIVASSGELWRRTRTFASTTSKKFGFGKASFEKAITDEVDVLLGDLQTRCDGEAFDMKSTVMSSVASIICNVILGRRFDQDDPKLHQFVQNSITSAEINASIGIITAFPFMKYVPGDILEIKKFERSVYAVWKLFQEVVDEHKSTVTEGITRDFIDAFLHSQQQDSESDSIFTDDNLMLCLSDIFFAGTETSSTVITWGAIYLIHHPRVQERMRAEMSRVVGDGRILSLSDRPEMPYCEAVTHEVIRCANVVPLSLPHTASKETTIGGYTIPKGAFVLPNIGSVLNDPDEFTNPDVFNPDRFIDSDGNLCDHDKVALAFLLGRRVCMGEALARMQIFLILTSLVQRFELLSVDESSLPSLDRIEGMVNTPRNPFLRIKEATPL